MVALLVGLSWADAPHRAVPDEAAHQAAAAPRKKRKRGEAPPPPVAPEPEPPPPPPPPRPAFGGDGCVGSWSGRWTLEGDTGALVEWAHVPLEFRMPAALSGWEAQGAGTSSLLFVGPSEAGGAQPVLALLVGEACQKPDPRPVQRAVTAQALGVETGAVLSAPDTWQVSVRSTPLDLVLQGEPVPGRPLLVSWAVVASTPDASIGIASACPHAPGAPDGACVAALRALYEALMVPVDALANDPG